jgi:hypothetical protein
MARLVLVFAALVLSACATAPQRDGLPMVRFADAASRGGVYAVTTARPTVADVGEAEVLWRRGIAEAAACRLPRMDTVRTALAGAVELATMTALAKDGEGNVDDQVLKRLARTLVGDLLSPGDRPSAARCRTVQRWSGQVRADASEAIGRAAAKGLVPLL